MGIKMRGFLSGLTGGIAAGQQLKGLYDESKTGEEFKRIGEVEPEAYTAEGDVTRYSYMGKDFDKMPSAEDREPLKQSRMADYLQGKGKWQEAMKLRAQSGELITQGLQRDAARQGLKKGEFELSALQRKQASENEVRNLFQEYGAAVRNPEKWGEFVQGSVPAYNKNEGPMNDGAIIQTTPEGIAYHIGQDGVRRYDLNNPTPEQRQQFADLALRARLAAHPEWYERITKMNVEDRKLFLDQMVAQSGRISAEAARTNADSGARTARVAERGADREDKLLPVREDEIRSRTEENRSTVRVNNARVGQIGAAIRASGASAAKQERALVHLETYNLIGARLNDALEAGDTKLAGQLRQQLNGVAAQMSTALGKPIQLRGERDGTTYTITEEDPKTGRKTEIKGPGTPPDTARFGDYGKAAAGLAAGMGVEAAGRKAKGDERRKAQSDVEELIRGSGLTGRSADRRAYEGRPTRTQGLTAPRGFTLYPAE